MSLSISVPTSPSERSIITLSGSEYEFFFNFNTRDSRWRLSIKQGNTSIVSGIKIVESQDLLGRYLLEGFSHGNLYCIRFKEDGEPVGRDNFGIDKAYELVYLTNQEIVDIQEG